MRRTRLRLQVGMAGTGGREEWGEMMGGRKGEGEEVGREGGRQVARLESEGVKRSPSHFCSSASPESLHAHPQPP